MTNDFFDGKKYYIACICVGIFALLLCLYFGNKKSGYYMDEYYTICDANGVGEGIKIENCTWNTTDEYIKQLTYSSDDSLSQLMFNTANNSHPFGYYVLIRFMSMLFPSVFSKWIGLSVNMLIFLVGMGVSWLLAYRLTKGNKKLTLVSLATYALSPAIISGVMLIRMYLLFSVFTMLFSALVIRTIKEDETFNKKTLISTFVLSFCGFMVHYYYVIFLFFITFFLCSYFMFIRKKIKDSIAFGLTVLLGLCSTYIIWPTSVYMIFKSGRGTGSMEDLVNVSSAVWVRLKLFTGLLNRGVFGGLIIPAILIVICCSFFAYKRRECYRLSEDFDKSKVAGLLILSAVCLCYFAVITKIGLRAGDASNRYMYPIYGIIIIIFVSYADFFFRQFKQTKEKACLYTVLILAIMIICGYARGQVLYLYESEAELTKWQTENSDERVIVVHREDGQVDSRIADYMRFDKVFFVTEDTVININDSEISSADELMVYVDKKADAEKALDMICSKNENSLEASLFFSCENGFDIYLLK